MQGVGVGTDLHSLTWTTAKLVARIKMVVTRGYRQVTWRITQDISFTAAGTHYITGRIKKDAGDAYTYSDGVTAGNYGPMRYSLSSASCGYLTVSALPDPAGCTSANTTHNSTDLSCGRSKHHSSGSGSYDVLVLRKTSAFDGPDKFHQSGSSGSAGNTTGGATVVCSGNVSRH